MVPLPEGMEELVDDLRVVSPEMLFNKLWLTHLAVYRLHQELHRYNDHCIVSLALQGSSVTGVLLFVKCNLN